MIIACQCGVRPLKKRKRTVPWKGITIHGVPTYECPRCKEIYYEARTRSRLDELAKNAAADQIYFRPAKPLPKNPETTPKRKSLQKQTLPTQTGKSDV